MVQANHEDSNHFDIRLYIRHNCASVDLQLSWCHGLFASRFDIHKYFYQLWLSGEPDYFGRNKISSGGDLPHYSSASLY